MLFLDTKSLMLLLKPLENNYIKAQTIKIYTLYSSAYLINEINFKTKNILTGHYK